MVTNEATILPRCGGGAKISQSKRYQVVNLNSLPPEPLAMC